MPSSAPILSASLTFPKHRTGKNVEIAGCFFSARNIYDSGLVVPVKRHGLTHWKLGGIHLGAALGDRRRTTWLHG